MNQRRSSAIILYHFFHPDDVVSARHFSQFAEELVKRGWNVTVLTSNRYCHYPSRKIPQQREYWQGVYIIRIKRPGWNQTKRVIRLVNFIWMMFGWSIKLCKVPRADVIIIGSDPPFSALLSPFLRFLKRGRLIVHWCHDLYPEAIIADGAKGFIKWIANKLTYLMRWAYRSIDLIVDIGPCMRRRLDAYHHNAYSVTLTPWALVEPNVFKGSDTTRSTLFGDAKLVLLYSGNMGRAHDYSLFLQLARRIYKDEPKILFFFACRGSRYNELTLAIRPNDYNIHLLPFVNESDLEMRLISADIHLVSLRPEWEGISVPSKFFASLAVGRPVIYAGPEGSAIARWIRRYNLGVILTEDNIEEVTKILLDIAEQPDKLKEWQENAFKVYKKYFSKTYMMDRWDKILRDLLNLKGF